MVRLGCWTDADAATFGSTLIVAWMLLARDARDRALESSEPSFEASAENSELSFER